MSFRNKLLLMFTVTVVIVVALVGAAVSLMMRRTFERADDARKAALEAQFRADFARRSDEVAAAVDRIAAREATLRLAAEAGRPAPDFAPYANDAEPLARAHGLEFLELLARDGSIISSAQWPARFGYKDTTVPLDAEGAPAFLKLEELPGGTTLGLIAVRAARAGDGVVYVAGGRSLDRSFLASLALSPGMRVLLYRNLTGGFNPDALSATAAVPNPDRLAPLIENVRRDPREMTAVVTWSADPGDADAIRAIPLTGRRGELLGVLMVASSRREVVELERRILLVTLLVGAGGVLLGFLLSTWFAARITEPVEKLAEAAREVTRGNWDARVYLEQDEAARLPAPATAMVPKDPAEREAKAEIAFESQDELVQLARAFNRMTAELGEQRDRLVQTERVAAWRELARRLAHELKNPLFPLQLTVENLARARALAPAQFDEIFDESTRTLLAELRNMNEIVARFSDFARMPAPKLLPVQINELAEQALALVQASARSREAAPRIETRSELDPELPIALADRELLYRALSNLVLNALDAMPQGGILTVRTAHRGNLAAIEIADTGAGMTREECERIFTPYYTTKQHGTGLGLAIVQSVVSDHGGRVWVTSAPGAGSTFHVEVPLQPGSISPAGSS